MDGQTVIYRENGWEEGAGLELGVRAGQDIHGAGVEEKIVEREQWQKG